MRPETKALLLALAVATGCGDPLVFAEVEEPRACITQPGQTFPGLTTLGVPPGTPQPLPVALPFTLSHEDTFDIGKTILAVKGAGTSGSMKALDFALEASTNVDLGGVTTATVTVLPPDAASTLPERAILSLTGAGHPAANKLLLSGSGVNILPYVLTGKLHYRFDADGSTQTLPEDDWSSSLTLCLYLKVKSDLTQLGK